jgi:hypothetical protein
MNFRQTGILLAAVFAVGLAALVWSFFGTGDDTPDTQFLCEELAGTKPEQIDTIEIEREGVGRVKLVRPDPKTNNWFMEEPYRAPADGTAAQAVATALLGAKPIAHPELRSNRAEHGLAPAGLRVTLRHGPTKSSTVNVGDVTIGGARSGVAFVTTSKRERPMAVSRGDLDALFREPKGGVKATDIAKWTEDYRSKNVFPGDSRAFGEDVVVLKVSAPNKKQEFQLSRSATGGWKFDAPAWGDADSEGADAAASATQFTGVLPLLRTLTNLSAASATDILGDPKEPKDFGLNADNPDRVRVEMKTKDGQSAVVFLGKYEPTAAPPPPKKDNPFAPPPPPALGGKVYAQIEGVPGVVRCTAGNLAPLLPTLADPSVLRDRDLIRLAPGKTVDGFDIVLKDQPADRPTKVRRIGQDWKLFGGAGDPQLAFGAPVQRLIDAATAKRVVRDFLAPGAVKFEPVATLWVWSDGFNAPTAPAAEPVSKGEYTTLEFGPKQGDGVVVRRTLPGNKVSEFIVYASVKTGAGTETVDLVGAVSKSRLDLLDPALPTFGSDAVTKLAVTGAANYALVRDEKPDARARETLWRYAEPASQKGQVADGGGVRDLLGLLATAQSTFGKFVAENPANLAEYGLDKPVLKVVVSTGPKPEDERGFEFGKDADGDKVFARVIGKPAVFTLQRRTFDRLTAPDLRDRVVLRGVKPDEATRVELKGWGHIVGGTPIDLDLAKNKDGAWTATKGPQGFAVDPAKVQAFLDLLATARARTFEPGTPEPKHGFGDANQFLQVNVYQPGGVIALNVAASPDGGGTYYVWTNALPAAQPIVTVDGPPFKPYKDRPATAFGK